MKYWLMKSEPTCFSINDLCAAPNQSAAWDGVRNYQARNFIRDMSIGDQVFFYHSSCTPPGIVGIAEVITDAYPDHTAFDATSEHPDLKSTRDNPIWFMVDVRFKKKFKQPITLNQLKQCPELKDMRLLQKGNRLSIMPISSFEWNFIFKVFSTVTI